MLHPFFFFTIIIAFFSYYFLPFELLYPLSSVSIKWKEDAFLPRYFNEKKEMERPTTSKKGRVTLILSTARGDQRASVCVCVNEREARRCVSILPILYCYPSRRASSTQLKALALMPISFSTTSGSVLLKRGCKSKYPRTFHPAMQLVLSSLNACYLFLLVVL